MRRFNKILALVLAMIMMCGIVSICASAADTSNAAYKVSYVGADGKTAISEAKAGDVVNVILSIKTNNSYSPIFAAHLYYDSNVFTHARNTGKEGSLSAKNCGEVLGRFAIATPIEDVSDELLAHEDDVAGNGYVNDWGAGNSVAMSGHKDSMYPDSFTDAQKAQFKAAYFGYAANGGDSNLTVNTEGQFVDFVRFCFIVKADTVLDKTVLFLAEDDKRNYVMIDVDDEPLRNGQTSNPVKTETLTIEYPTAGGNEGGDDTGDTPTVTAPVSSKEVQVKWKDKANNEIYIGFCGEYAGTVTTTKDPVTGKEIVNEITEIGFLFSTSNNTFAEGTYTQRAAETLYDFGSGTYKFRVVAEATTNSTLPLYGKAYIKLAGSDTILLANDKIETTVAAEYEEATKMPGFNA